MSVTQTPAATRAKTSPGEKSSVAILGPVTSADDVDKLIGLLRDADGLVPLQFDFYDADVLPGALVEAMSEALLRGTPLNIVAYRAVLAHSLMRLGLPVQQVLGSPPLLPILPCRAVVLAGSAHSLDKIFTIVSRLPLGDVSIFIIQHVQDGTLNLLDQLLKVRTRYRVVMPQHMMPIEAGVMYVAPPGFHMKVAHGLVYLTADLPVQFARPSIDVLFESIAEEYGGQALAALLCGFGQDGVAGCAALRAAGAQVLVEDGAECEAARVMPDAARAARHYDQVLKCTAIASLAACTLSGATAAPTGALLELFLDAVLAQYGFDFRGYQRDSLERRIRNMTTRFGLSSFLDFQRAVLGDAALFERMCADFSVGVSAFFRHPEQFRLVRLEVLPYLASFPVIKIWSAGCATGEEAYSLAIMQDELGLIERSQLFATDINQHLLDQARNGQFPSAPLAQNRENYLASGGERLFDVHVPLCGHFLAIHEAFRSRVLFYRHSLADPGVFNEFQLIICRNVMIYFNPELQRQVLQRFIQSLHADGFLVLGPQDGLHVLAQEQGFVPFKAGSHIYRHPRSVA